MSEFLQYAYVFLWGALAILMFITTFKQGVIALVPALFFVFMTVWYGLRAFGNYPMFEGTAGIVFRCVLGGFLALFAVVWLIAKRMGKK